MGVKERPMKFTTNSTAISGTTPGIRRMSPKASRGWPSAAAASGGSSKYRTSRTSATAQAAAVTTNVQRMPTVSARRPPDKGPTAAARICADWMPPTARPVCSRGASAVAMARPSGPIPPKRPTAVRSAKSCQTSVTAPESASRTT